MQFCVPNDGRKIRLKHVERLTEINKFEKLCILLVVLCDILAMHGPMNVKVKSPVACAQTYDVYQPGGLWRRYDYSYETAN